MKKILFSAVCLALSVIAFAQTTASAAEADRQASGLRADGKIYVVVAVLVVILCGLFLYLIRLDRKITKIERQSK